MVSLFLKVSIPKNLVKKFGLDSVKHMRTLISTNLRLIKDLVLIQAHIEV